MTRFPPLNVVQISHAGGNATNSEIPVVLIPGIAIVLQLRLENLWSCNVRSHGDTNKAHNKITKIFKFKKVSKPPQ